MLWTKAESNEYPVEIQKLNNNRIIVRENIKQETTNEGNIKYVYDERIMNEMEYAVIEVVNGIELKRENEIIDEYTMILIEEGVL